MLKIDARIDESAENLKQINYHLKYTTVGKCVLSNYSSNIKKAITANLRHNKTGVFIFIYSHLTFLIHTLNRNGSNKNYRNCEMIKSIVVINDSIVAIRNA